MEFVCRHCNELCDDEAYRVVSVDNDVVLLNMIVCYRCAMVARDLNLPTQKIDYLPSGNQRPLLERNFLQQGSFADLVKKSCNISLLCHSTIWHTFCRLSHSDERFIACMTRSNQEGSDEFTEGCIPSRDYARAIFVHDDVSVNRNANRVFMLVSEQIMRFVVMSILSYLWRRRGDSGKPVALVGREPAQAATQKYVDAETAQRLFRIITPLLRAMEHSLGPHQVSIGIVADDAINAANGGGGKFIVTTGLLERANDEQLRGVMAHEIAHEDLGHVTKLKISATGANMVLLEQLAAESTRVNTD